MMFSGFFPAKIKNNDLNKITKLKNFIKRFKQIIIFVTVFPNPTTEVLNVQCEKPIRRCDVYSLTGELLLSITDSAETIEIAVGNLPAGAYLIKLMTDSTEQMKKFVKR